jgi:hypothetical protein
VVAAPASVVAPGTEAVEPSVGAVDVAVALVVALVVVAGFELPPWCITRVRSRKATTTPSRPSTAIWATGLSFRALLTKWPLPPAAAEPQRMKAPTCRCRSA